MIAHWHLLGSVRGYTTLGHGPGLRADERAELESVGFGQSDDPTFRDSLFARPAGLGRPLTSGRYALTRCLPGAGDASGRSTLLFASLVFERADWVAAVSQNLGAALADAELWARITASPQGAVEINGSRWTPPPFSANAALAILDAWIQRPSGTGALIAVTDTPEHAAAILALPRLLPPADRMSLAWGVRLLSTGAPVSVASLAAAPDQRRTIIAPRFGKALAHPYARAVASFWQSAGAFPAAFIAGVESVERVSQQNTPAPAAAAVPAGRSGLRASPVILAGGVLLVAIAGGIWLATGSSRRSATSGESATRSAADSSPRQAPAATPAPSRLPAQKSAATTTTRSRVPIPAPAAAASRAVAEAIGLNSCWESRSEWTAPELAAFIEDARLVLFLCSGLAAGDAAFAAPELLPGAEEIPLPLQTDPFILALRDRLREATEASRWIAEARDEVAFRMPAHARSISEAQGSTARTQAVAERRAALLRTAPYIIARAQVQSLERAIRIQMALNSPSSRSSAPPDRVVPAEDRARKPR